MSEDPHKRYSIAIDEANNAHRQALSNIWKIAESIKSDASLTAEVKNKLLAEAFSRLSMKDIKYTILDDVVAHKIGVSFRDSISHTRHTKSRMKKLGYVIAPASNDKLKDRKFAKRLGIAVPETHATGKYLNDLPLHENSVIKPVAGDSSKGVYHVESTQRIRSFRTGKVYTSLGEAKEELQGAKILQQRVWVEEEAVLGAQGLPAHDLKVYMFYGEPGIVQEIRRGHSEDKALEFCHYDPKGNHIRFGGIRKTFEGNGFHPSLLEAAKTISLAMPTPFVRVDFHAGIKTHYLGEITAHPGGTAVGEITDSMDKYLGNMFLDAEARLFVDMLNGKQFDTYFDAYK
ncbi:MAG: hypothetical protein HLX51_14095 [Micrococcaceae bacterium]|nr:hypothetical protein [Micrococcaceae bacterium]